MSDLILKRIRSNEDGTFGNLFMGNTQVCVTCELPWKGNQQKISCIPIGVYNYIPHNSPKFPESIELVGVNNRSMILIHNGNTIDDTDGCILVGSEFGEINGKPAVLHSKQTLQMLIGLAPEYGTIEITENL